MRAPPAALLIALLMTASTLALASPAAADRSGSTTNDEIARLYLGVFGRSPDLAGEAFWNHQANSGVSTARIAEFFVDSPEFRQRFGTDDEAILTALYRNVFGRNPDVGGFDFWAQQLDQGLEISTLVRNFTESPENLTIAAATTSRYDTHDRTTCDSPIDDYLREYIERMDRTVTIAVHDLRSDCFYNLGGNEFMTVASTLKLAVMGSMLLRAQDEGRTLTATERRQLDGMIRFSDNDDVRPIFESMGGSNAMLETYGSRLGISNWVDNARWGCIAWSAASATSLIEHLTVDGVGELTPANQAVARGLLTNVTETQRWGVGDGTLGVVDGTVAQKNGFSTPCDGGSQINSVGLVFDEDGAAAYSIAIYSSGWVDDVRASRQNDQPAYVREARGHIDHIAEHIARMLAH